MQSFTFHETGAQVAPVFCRAPSVVSMRGGIIEGFEDFDRDNPEDLDRYLDAIYEEEARERQEVEERGYFADDEDSWSEEGSQVDWFDAEEELSIEDLVNNFFEDLRVELGAFGHSLAAAIEEDLDQSSQTIEEWLEGFSSPEPRSPRSPFPSHYSEPQWPSPGASSTSGSSSSTLVASPERLGYFELMDHPQNYAEEGNMSDVQESGVVFTNPFTQSRSSRNNPVSSDDISPLQSADEQVPLIPARNPARLNPAPAQPQNDTIENMLATLNDDLDTLDEQFNQSNQFYQFNQLPQFDIGWDVIEE